MIVKRKTLITDRGRETQPTLQPLWLVRLYTQIIRQKRGIFIVLYIVLRLTIYSGLPKQLSYNYETPFDVSRPTASLFELRFQIMSESFPMLQKKTNSTNPPVDIYFGIDLQIICSLIMYLPLDLLLVIGPILLYPHMFSTATYSAPRPSRLSQFIFLF